ncbi:hypothetical protein BC831DRAFT_182034 [Entophlyctis helioformis]|nr:hypothetical protein BC831DRAFT_182034 [Entophlyctis helioformis]
MLPVAVFSQTAQLPARPLCGCVQPRQQRRTTNRHSAVCTARSRPLLRCGGCWHGMPLPLAGPMGVDSEDLIGLVWFEARLEHPAQQHCADPACLGWKAAWSAAVVSVSSQQSTHRHAQDGPCCHAVIDETLLALNPNIGNILRTRHARQVASSRECSHVLPADRKRKRTKKNVHKIKNGLYWYASNSISSSARASPHKTAFVCCLPQEREWARA